MIRSLLLWTALAAAAVAASEPAPPTPAPARAPSGPPANSAPAAPAAAYRLPEVRSGPYRVVVDRIHHNQNLSLSFGEGGSPARKKASAPSLQSRRTVQLQLAVYGEGDAAAGLAAVQVKGASAEVGRRLVSLGHYGGTLDTREEKALVRAYLFIPEFPNDAREVRLLEGEIVSYERAAQLELELTLERLPDRAAPLVAEREGVRAILHECSVSGTNVQLLVTVEAAGSAALSHTSSEGAYGLALYDADGRPAAPAGGTVTQLRPGALEYRVTFQNVRSAPGRLRIPVFFRGGARRVYPFRIEHIPVPVRPVGAP